MKPYDKKTVKHYEQLKQNYEQLWTNSSFDSFKCVYLFFLSHDWHDIWDIAYALDGDS